MCISTYGVNNLVKALLMINVQHRGVGFGCTYANRLREDDYANGIGKCFGRDEIGEFIFKTCILPCTTCRVLLFWMIN